MESVAFGVPTVTTSLSGFGMWVNNTFGEDAFALSGVHVSERNDGNYFELCQSIASRLKEIMRADEKPEAALRAAASATADRAEWAHFMEYYLVAYAEAMKSAHQRTFDNKK